MILSRGDPTTFVTRPISATLLLIALAVLVVVFLPSVKKSASRSSSRRTEPDQPGCTGRTAPHAPAY